MKLSSAVIFASAAVFVSADGEPQNLRRRLASASGSIRACFSDISTADVFGKGPVQMKDLQVGDRILTGEGQYQPIYAWAHLDKDTVTEFLQIETEKSSSSLEVTSDHLLFVDDKPSPVHAGSIKIGESLQGSPVTKIGRIEKAGLYVPLTESGTLVVNGVKASSYITLQEGSDNVELQGGFQLMSQHDFVHLMLSPFRMMCMGGVSSAACHSYNENGMPHYIGYGLELAEWANQLPLLLQGVLFAAFVFLARAFMLFEGLFGASYGPTMMLASALGAAALWKVFGARARANQKAKTV